MRRLRRSTLALACALALAGCNDHRLGFFPETESDGFDPSTTTETTTSPTTLSPTTVSPTVPTTVPTSITITSDTQTVTTEPVTSVTTFDPTEGFECGELQLGSSLPAGLHGTLAGQGDAFSLTCGGVGGSDLAVLWTAPFTGRFQFDTIGSNFDSLLGIIDGSCFGQELACDDDSGGTLQSLLQVDLVAGQAITVVVDSFGQSVGEVALNITEVPPVDECPDAFFDPIVPLVIDGQTLGASDIRAGSCGGADSPDIEALWIAPFDGLFAFQVVEADFDPVVYLRDAACDGPEIVCNDDSNGLFPAVAAPLFAGQAVVIVVDGVGGQAGKFLLEITEL